jgi:CRISPR-associated protein Csx17
MRHLPLKGCTPIPLASYLKALGIHRLLVEQKYPSCRGSWKSNHYSLETASIKDGFDQKALCDFFLTEYQPTPVLAPWNGGSQFYPKDNKSAIQAIEASGSPRFAEFRKAILFSKNLVQQLGLREKPSGSAKSQLLRLFRSQAPESALKWFNAAVLLAGEEPRFPPLLGTGGNDGRLDFTSNYMQRLLELFDLSTGEPQGKCETWLDNALFGKPIAGLTNNSIGQFSPGMAGGPNASSGFEAKAQINPWDFVLMLEGAIAFAAATSRRLESSNNEGMSYPFTVRPTPVGGGAESLEDEKNARAELWLPLWEAPATWPELHMLLSEGRARVGTRPARDGLDFIRSISGLGVDRGISSFQRYGFLMRAGLSYLATPLSRVKVRRNPNADLMNQLERGGFLFTIRKMARNENLPGSFRQSVWNLERALFKMAEQGSPMNVQNSLMALGEVITRMGPMARREENLVRPPHLDITWVHQADDGSSEFRIAIALAGLGQGKDSSVSLVSHLFPLLPLRGKELDWKTDSPEFVWKGQSLVQGLIQIAQRRTLTSGRDPNAPRKPFFSPIGVPEGNLAAWLHHLLPGSADTKIQKLVRGLALCRLSKYPPSSTSYQEEERLPPTWFALRAFFTEEKLLIKAGLIPPEGRLPLDARILRLLLADRVHEAGKWAWQRLAVHGAILPNFSWNSPPQLAHHFEGKRLLASLLIPLHFPDLIRGIQTIAKTTSTIDPDAGLKQPLEDIT